MKPSNKIVSSSVGSCVVFKILSKDPITDELWKEKVLDLLNQKEITKILVISEGDAWIKASVTQMRDSARIVRDRKQKAVVLTDHRSTRALVKAASWIGADAMTFPFSEKEKAFDFLCLSPLEKTNLKSLLEEIS